MILNSQLLNKYTSFAPRYTSYPPVPYWNNQNTEEQWLKQLKLNYQLTLGIDLYVHIPFCKSLCYYCGCNKIVTSNESQQEKYIQLIIKEWELYLNKLGFIPKINSIHFGGGTPTFLSPNNLNKLIKNLISHKSELIHIICYRGPVT